MTRHTEKGGSAKVCLRGGHDGVEWDGGCCSKARTGFTWEELREVRTYSKESCHPTPTLAKSPMPTKNEIALTFSLILADDWSLDVTCHSAPGHHLAVRGFELARKHHMQEGHKINARSGADPRRAARGEARTSSGRSSVLGSSRRSTLPPRAARGACSAVTRSAAPRGYPR